ncbi:protein of unknown function [Oceanospirillum multiglobuliferum]|uniref:DUF4202 domain-containing protein n=1 Tax=Oceanospirillum multiglobuliferum TaxID=64969 RepID=A0A1T4SL40_9GAMM|nr:DUF4202 domain-containing protein [Oceanospirillum multiglobuliferum]OPX54197.1 hypothetical protein BTE48_15495 [Oceanospirillum multiglobuliferum]SKA29000.1 protein of unknown function [Oceanospirillum multiglobuliferum]
MSELDRLEQTLRLIDQANSEDPNIEEWLGQLYAKELLYGIRMSNRLDQYMPDAPDYLRIAARAQHIQRWTIKRSDYPEGKVGYKHWRTELGRFHAETAAALMAETGYPQADVERVKSLIQKKQLKQDPEVQILEDVICLVFLEFYLEEFATKHSEEKLISIIQKTWQKMSEKGHEIALKLPLSEPMLALVQKALA